MIFERTIKPTLTPFQLDAEDELKLTLRDGRLWEMKLLGARAEVVARGFDRYQDRGHACGDISVYAFEATVLINGSEHVMRREVGSQASFYQPWTVDGVRIWFDAASCCYKDNGGFMEEKDWKAGVIGKPARLTRWAVQEEGLSICPEPLTDWYPNPTGTLDIRNCYTGEDCYLGPYSGGSAHAGLDINMPKGTILTAPFDLTDHFLQRSLGAGFRNNSWIGLRRWADNASWLIGTAHVIDIIAPPHRPLKRGTPYATAAGVFVGFHEHTHFAWEVYDQGGRYSLDPWILMSEIWRKN